MQEESVVQSGFGRITEPGFCQWKSGGGILLLTDILKLNEILERDEWPFETINFMINSMGVFNCTTKLDQVMRDFAMKVEKEDQTCLGIISPW